MKWRPFAPGLAPGLTLGHTDSAGEQVQRWLPESRVVKAFNSVGYALMFQPDFADGPPDMFICGNDDAAKKTVTDILTSFGWSTIDVGSIEAVLLGNLCAILINGLCDSPPELRSRDQIHSASRRPAIAGSVLFALDPRSPLGFP